MGAVVALSCLAGPAAAGDKPTGPLLQLGLYATRGDAEWAWIALTRKQSSLSERLGVTIAPGPNGNGAVLRARAKDAGANGDGLCRDILKYGQSCFVVRGDDRPEPRVEARKDDGRRDEPRHAANIPVPGIKPAAPPRPVVAAAPSPVPPPVAPAAAPAPAVAVAAPVAATVTVINPAVNPVAPQAVSPAPSPAVDALTVTAVASPPVAPIAPAANPAAVAAPPAPPLSAAGPKAPPMSDGGQLAARTLDGFIRYSTDDAKVLAEIERRTRRRGRIGAVLPGGGLEVTPAILTQPEFNICALTFDDGPHRTVTRRILDTLNQLKVVSTYFPVGNVAIRNPEIIRDFVASGHEIGNHSYTHNDLRSMSGEALRYEVTETNKILRSMGATSILFRPPYGRYNQELLQIVREEGSQAVLWNVDTRDWKVRDPDKIVEHVITAAGSGSVLLLHSTYPSTADALPRVISSLREKNCEFVTLSDWISRMQAAGELPVTNAALPGPIVTATRTR